MTTPPYEPPEGEQRTEEAYEPRCPRCGSPHDPLQEYCLECGQRLVPLPGGTTTVTSETWSRESPLWLWLALGALLLVALAAGAIVALAATDDDDDRPASATSGPVSESFPVVPTTGPPTIETVTSPTLTIGPPTTTTAPTTSPTTTMGTTTSPTTTTTPTTTGTGSFIPWPPSRDGWTVVLRSTPTSQGRGPAEATARDAQNAGLPQVGILESSDYSSLNPGYYVTFTGVYDSRNQAENAIPRARNAGFPTAYVREISD